MRIDKIKIKNFKRVSEVEIDLNNINYLVGGNNSGKSSVLQAIHMAVSCAQMSSELQQQVIAESSLRYSPTGEFQNLGNSGPYENRKEGSRGTIEFFGKTADEADASYRVEIYKARNYHNIGVDRSGIYPGFGQHICDSKSLFSVYVPGLAGVPHREEMQGYASVFRRAAGGEANLVFRNIIRLLSDKNKISELEDLLFEVIGPAKFKVNFDPNKDLYVDVSLSLQEGHDESSYVPIDLCGTGVIQITQILSYVILFRPKILLVDEPDSHLHPSRQVLLSAAFDHIVNRYECSVIVSTHSRHLVSSAPDNTKVIWMKNGVVETQEGQGLAEILLDLGALDQIDSSGAEIILCTEDKGKVQLEACIASLNLDGKVKVISYNGVTNAASAVVIQAMADLFANKPRIIIHRDRDFLNDEEIAKWGAEYINRGMSIFCPTLNDIESHFISVEHVARVYEQSVEDINERLENIRNDISQEMRGKFREKRREAIAKFWKDGGGPVTDELWPEGDLMTDDRMLGKMVLKRLNEELPKAFGSRRNLMGTKSDLLEAELRALFG